MTIDFTPKSLVPGAFLMLFPVLELLLLPCCVVLFKCDSLIGRLTVVSGWHNSKYPHAGKKLCFMNIKRMPPPFSIF